jgi:putative flippase GtrA
MSRRDRARHHALRFSRSLVVGAVATLVDLAVLTTLVQVFGVSAQWANVPSLVAGLTVQFLGNRTFVFKAGGGRLSRQLGAFLVAEAGALVLNALGFAALVAWSPVPYPLARLLGEAVVYVGYSYPLWHKVFRDAQVTAGQP